MIISQSGIDMVKKFEGCVLKAYDDGVGTLTIGYGHTDGVKKGQTITQKQADDFLYHDLMYCCNEVQKLINIGTIVFKVGQNMFDALVSFDFNLGQGNLVKLVTQRSVSEVAGKMLLYVNAGGKVMQGLVNRRQAEQNLFLKPDTVLNTEHVQQRYTVKRGDNLTVISRKLGVTIDHLANLNNIKNINLIYPGQVLKY